MWSIRSNLYYFFLQNGFTLADELLLALLTFFIVFSFLSLCRLIFEIIFTQLENRFQNGRFKIWLSIADNLSYLFIFLTALFTASFCFYLSPAISKFFDGIYIFILVFVVINFIREFLSNSVRIFLMSKSNVSKEAIKTAINFTDVVSLIVLWILVVLIFLQFSDYDAQALLGGLGIASVIVAFSFQNTLKDVFAFFSIYIDRSFAVGDYIVFDDVEGTIKEIRLRTTKITALKGNDIIIPNDKITSGIIENYNRLPRRRVSINFTLEPNLSPQKSKDFVAQLYDNLIGDTTFTEKLDIRCVTLDEITDQGLRFKVIYYFHGSSYMEHLQYKEKVNLIILETLEKNKISLVQIPILKN